MHSDSCTGVSCGFPAASQFLQGLLLLILTLLLVQNSTAQPRAIGPDDVSRLRQQTEFSGDWSETDAFDLEHYLTLRVTIEQFDMPEDVGNVVLWFTAENAGKLAHFSELPADFRFKGMLQSADAVRALDLSERDFPEGVEAVVRGWPATDRNVTGTALLIDDITIVSSGRTIALHGDNRKLDPRRDTTSQAD